MYYGDPFNGRGIDAQAIVTFVNDRRQGAEDSYRPFFAKTKAWYNIYRGIISGKFPSHRNDISVPMLFSYVLSDVSNKAQALFASQDIVQFQPRSDIDVSIAKKNTKLINQQLLDADTYAKGVDFLLSAAIYGTGIARLSWKFDQQDRLFRTRVLDQELTVRQPQVLFDGPNWDVVDILDFLPEPGKRRLRDCTWVIHTYYIDFDDLLAMQFDGRSMFDPVGIQELAQSPMSMQTVEAWKLRVTTYRTAQDMANRAVQRFSKPVRIDEYWGKVPQEFASNGDRNVVITVANQKVLLRHESNPFWNGQIPFLIYTPMPDIHALHGTGKCEIGEKLQSTINRLANIKLDAMEIFGAPMFFVNDQSGLDGQTLVSRPARMFKVTGDKVSDAVMPVSPDIRALGMIYNEIQQLGVFQQQGLGIDNSAIQGMEGPDRETAAGFFGRRDAALGRLAGEAELCGRMFVEPLADWFRDADRQLLTLPKQIAYLGPDAVLDPDSGLPVPQDQQSIGLDDLHPDFRSRAMGASHIIGKDLVAQKLLTYAQIAATNPVMLQITNWVSFTKDLARALNLNPAELLVQQVIPLVNQVAAGQGLGAGDMMGGMGMGQTAQPQQPPVNAMNMAQPMGA